MVPLYPVLVFLNAFLLFAAQPMAGRQLLPEFGGSPAVWTTCLLFFQAALLAGYLASHALVRRHWILFVPVAGFLALRFYPFTGPNGLILRQLLIGYGPECVILAFLSPTLQHSFASNTGQPPYRLYAFSNAGSLAALLLYPFLIEPLLPGGTQRLAWKLLTGCAVLLCLLLPRPVPMAAPSAKLATRQSLFWILLPALASALLAATTNQLTQDVAATPLLWILPLALYLLAFILTFESERWADPRLYGLVAGVAVLMACVVQATGVYLPLWFRTLVYLIALFTGCMVCFSELVKRRPPPEALTGFYLAIAVGGVLGTALIAFAAPLAFKRYDEFPLALIGCLAVRFLGWREDQARGPLRWLAPALSIAAALYLVAKPDSVLVLKRVRGFHGAVQVVADRDEAAGPHKVLTHGTIKHGVQYLDPEKRLWPTAYYGADSGAGRVLTHLAQGEPKRIAAIGLGVGTLAVHGRPQDTYRFFEINPDVAAIAQQDFRYLRDSPPRVEIVIGDGRLMLARERAPFDAILVDAFSSDAIPTHLLTAEAGEIYRRQLKPGGHLLIHITNRSVDLTPVARGLARHLGWQAHRLWAKSDPARGTYFNVWMLLSPDPASVLALVPASALLPFSDSGPANARDRDRPPILWTDAHASLLPVLR